MKAKNLILVLPIILLTACTSGSDSSRLASFLCEDLTSKDASHRQSISMIKDKLDKAKSLAEFHMEKMPWVYDKKTGDLYGYDEFEEAFVPLYKDEDKTSSSFYIWTEFEGKFSKDGKNWKIKTTGKSKNGLLPEVILYEQIGSYDIEASKMKTKLTENGVVTNWDTACVSIPVDGIDVKLKSKS